MNKDSREDKITQKLVSIIIPVYNVEAFLDKCVKTAREQTYKNIEIILVDDGSTDRCPEMCDRWVETDDRISVVHKKNGGLSSARNAGLDVATGEYVYFFDSDDYIEPDLLEKTTPFLDNGADLVSFRLVKEYPNGETYYSENRIGEVTLCNDTERLDFITDKFIRGFYGWEAWNRIFVRSIIEENKLRFADNKKVFAEDLCFSLCYLSHVSKYVAIPDCLYHYIVRENSIMSNNIGAINLYRFNELSKEVNSYYKKHNKSVLYDNFYKVNLLILYHQRKIIWQTVSDRKWMSRAELLHNVSDPDFLKSMIEQAINSNWKPEWMSQNIADEFLILCRYLSSGNYLAFWINNRKIYKQYYSHRSKDTIAEAISETGGQEKTQRIFILGTEEFGNIGDHQINESILQFIDEAFPKATIVEVTANEYFAYREHLVQSITNDDLIILPGGGNFGDVYTTPQSIKNDVVATWKNNLKIVFPQTIFFTETENGEKQKEIAQKLFTKQNNVTLYAREKFSYEYAKQLFSCEIALCPDIVLRKRMEHQENRKNHILWCMRSDIEKKYSEKDLNQITDYLCSNGIQKKRFDLQLPGHVLKEDRPWLTKYALRQFEESKLVITDRLHGMIFSAITCTPCIIFDNFNYKIEGSFNWIRHLPYIHYVSSVAEAIDIIKQTYETETKKYVYDNCSLLPYYKELEERIKRSLNGCY